MYSLAEVVLIFFVFFTVMAPLLFIGDDRQGGKFCCIAALVLGVTFLFLCVALRHVTY